MTDPKATPTPQAQAGDANDAWDARNERWRAYHAAEAQATGRDAVDEAKFWQYVRRCVSDDLSASYESDHQGCIATAKKYLAEVDRRAALAPSPPANAGQAVAWRIGTPSDGWWSHWMDYVHTTAEDRAKLQGAGYVAEYAYRPTVAAEGEVRLWDSQWVNVVNHDRAYADWNKDDAIARAVKLAARYLTQNVADNKLPPPRAALSSPDGLRKGEG